MLENKHWQTRPDDLLSFLMPALHAIKCPRCVVWAPKHSSTYPVFGFSLLPKRRLYVPCAFEIKTDEGWFQVHSWLKHKKISLMRHVHSRLKQSLNINAISLSSRLSHWRRRQELYCGSFQLTMSCERWFIFKEEYEVPSTTICFNVYSRSKHGEVSCQAHVYSHWNTLQKSKQYVMAMPNSTLFI
jgi:hypothetical protein